MDDNNEYGALEVQKELLSLLKRFCLFCNNHRIKYSLAYGSLLGAIRHKGFIPWDDDLDIIVDRENYKRLLMYIENDTELESIRVRWLDVIQFKEKISHKNPTLDIFILDYVPNNRIVQNAKLLTISLLQGMMKNRLYMKKGSILMRLSSLFSFLLGLLFSHELKFLWYSKVSQWGNSKNAKYMACYDASFMDIRCLFKKDIFEKVHLTIFEDTEAYIIDDYDDFLKSRYGDYLTPRQSKAYANK